MLGRFLRLFNGDFQFRPAHFDAVAVFECDLGVAALGPLLGSLAFFPRPEFCSVDVGAVQTAEIAQARRGRIDLKDEVVPGNLRVLRDTGVAVVQASEDEGIVLGEGEDFPDILALADLKMDFGTHGFGVALRRAGKIVNLPACLGLWTSKNPSSRCRRNHGLPAFHAGFAAPHIRPCERPVC